MGHAWIWVALILLISLIALMVRFGSRIYGGARKVAGSLYMESRSTHLPIEPASIEEIKAFLDKGNPSLLTIIGFGGIVIIA